MDGDQYDRAWRMYLELTDDEIRRDPNRNMTSRTAERRALASMEHLLPADVYADFAAVVVEQRRRFWGAAENHRTVSARIHPSAHVQDGGAAASSAA